MSPAAVNGHGAYGLRLSGLGEEPAVRKALVRAPEHWPDVHLEQQIADPPKEPGAFTPDWARIGLEGGGHVFADRRSRRVTFVSPQPVETDVLLHPALSFVGAVYSKWLGRQAIHAGAFVVDGEACALIGVSWGGKSSTLGWLAQAGSQILADDLVVIDDGAAFAGPRTLDLKPASARYLGHEGDRVRGGGRRRLALDGVKAEMPLRFWIALSWGDALEARRIPPSERLGVLLEHLQLRLHGPGSGALLDLAALPAFELRRPRQISSLPQAGAKILELASA